MNIDEIFGLKHEAGELCVSIVLPTYKKGTEVRENPALVRKALNDIKRQLADHHQNDYLLNKLDRLAAQVDFNHPTEGLGFFVSRSTEKLFQFDFPVRHNVLIGDIFDLRSLVADANQRVPVAVLSLGKTAQLYLGAGRKLVQVQDERFPKVFRESYDYPKAAPASLHQSAQTASQEKSKISERRLSVFYKSIDKALNVYLDKSHLLIVLGTDENLGLFLKQSPYKEQVVKTIPGNYEHLAVSDISELVYPVLEDYIAGHIAQVIGKLAEEGGKGLAVSGLSEVWNEAVKGSVRTLVVEKDFKPQAYKSADGQLRLSPTSDKDTLMPDVIDDIIEKVLERHGQVFFTDNNMLNGFGHIAAELRYHL